MAGGNWRDAVAVVFKLLSSLFSMTGWPFKIGTFTGLFGGVANGFMPGCLPNSALAMSSF